MNNERVNIRSLAQGGDGVASLPDGRVVFVRASCPGDDATIRITEEHPRWARGEIVQLHEPSPRRVEPPCPYFGACGGCQWQHVSYEEQRDAKRRILLDALTRIGRLADPAVDETVPSPDAYGYRNKIELSPATAGGGLALGFARSGTTDVLPIDNCLLLPEGASRLPAALSGALRFLAPRGLGSVLRATIRVSSAREVAIDLWTPGGPFPRALGARVIAQATGARTITRTILKGDYERHDISKVEVLSGPATWRESLGSDAYSVSAPSFFQVNTKAADLLRAEAIGALGIDGTMRVGDLYAGVGTFTLPICRQAGAVVAVEASRFALADLRRNLASARLSAEVVAGDAAYALPSLGRLDAALIDPPRSGLSARATSELIEAKIGRIVYVSCDPATLARDVRSLCDAGYRPRRFVPIDLFPQTHHVETVALLERFSD